VSREAIAVALHDLFITAPGTALRREDEKKVHELEGLLPEIARALGASKRARVLVDAAAGKAYAGILAVRLLGLGAHVRVIAIEHNHARNADARDAAASAGIELETRAGDVADPSLWPDAPDVVVALHACGDASDAIIDNAARARAKKLLLVPCCTGKSIAARARAVTKADALGLPEHAEVRARFYQALVDAERTLALEAAGYPVEVVAFVPSTVTPHNLLWRAVRDGEPRHAERAREQLEKLRATPR
jgi:hypothetical protein